MKTAGSQAKVKVTWRGGGGQSFALSQSVFSTVYESLADDNVRPLQRLQCHQCGGIVHILDSHLVGLYIGK